MTSPFQTRRRAEEFAAAVDGGGRRGAGATGDLADLVRLVETLRAQEPVVPRAEFSRDLRARLMTEAETVLRAESATLRLPTRERGHRERRLAAVASAFVLAGGTATMAAAAQSALPGDALYPIKRGIEQAEAGLSMSDVGRGSDLLHQASDRLAEVQGLVEGGSAESEPRIAETLTAFSDSAAEGSRLLLDSFEETSDPDAVVTVRTFAAEGIDTLEALAPAVPADAQDELAAAAQLVADIDRRAAAACDICADELPLVEVPRILLARAEVDRALGLVDAAALLNDHPVVVPKGVVGAARAPQPEAPGPSAATAAPAGPTAAPASPLPSPGTDEPEAWPSLLPGTDLGTESTTDEPTVTEKLVDGLSGAVETILPDTGLTD